MILFVVSDIFFLGIMYLFMIVVLYIVDNCIILEVFLRFVVFKLKWIKFFVFLRVGLEGMM